MGKSKILVCGDVNGKFKTLFTRVESINQKNGPFEMLLCVGSFFGASNKGLEPYINGTETVPVPTFILGPNSPDHVDQYEDVKGGGEICRNISYLGRRGLYTSTSGLRIAYVSGIEGQPGTISDFTFTIGDIKSLKNTCFKVRNFRGVDILITSPWPEDIEIGKEGQNHPDRSCLLSILAAQISPRYYFTGIEDIYYERPPYRNPSVTNDTQGHTTRYIAMAKVGNADKKKWIYALNLEPIDLMTSTALYQATTNETLSPFLGNMEMAKPSDKKEKTSQFFYDMDSGEEPQAKQRKREKKSAPIFNPDKCWFCLASSAVEKHLIISIGKQVYMALAKGALIPEHVLILPIGHHKSSACVPEEVDDEIKKFKSALKKCFKKQGLVPVYFERHYKTFHLQIQVVPVPRDIAPQLRQAFETSAEEDGIKLEELPPYTELSQIAKPDTPYFYVELPGGDRLFHRIISPFPLQFGREVLVSEEVLNMPERANWKDCSMSKDEELETVKKFRSAFKPYDFTV